MSKEQGPREKALREMREAKYADNHRKDRPDRKIAADLAAAIATAAKKTGKSRKAKK